MVGAWEQEGSFAIHPEHRMHGSFVEQLRPDLALNLEMLLSLPVETARRMREHGWVKDE